MTTGKELTNWATKRFNHIRKGQKEGYDMHIAIAESVGKYVSEAITEALGKEIYLSIRALTDPEPPHDHILNSFCDSPTEESLDMCAILSSLLEGIIIPEVKIELKKIVDAVECRPDIKILGKADPPNLHWETIYVVLYMPWYRAEIRVRVSNTMRFKPKYADHY